MIIRIVRSIERSFRERGFWNGYITKFCILLCHLYNLVSESWLRLGLCLFHVRNNEQNISYYLFNLCLSKLRLIFNFINKCYVSIIYIVFLIHEKHYFMNNMRLWVKYYFFMFSMALLHKPSIEGLFSNIISKWISPPLKSIVQPIGLPIIEP